ncbi:MAG: hypothetical protein Q8O86_06270 [Dehalococcoidia bacterium]|nr:hypothetical protein [Dehalococcoidia bacterium]
MITLFDISGPEETPPPERDGPVSAPKKGRRWLTLGIRGKVMGGFATVAAVFVMVVAVMVWRSLDFVDTEAFDSAQMLATSMAAAIGREAGDSGAPVLLRRPSDLQAYIEEMGALLGLGLVVVDGDGKALAAAPPRSGTPKAGY